MSKSKSKSKKKLKEDKISIDDKFSSDLKDISIPFDLFGGLTMVVNELKVKGFVYSHFSNNGKQDILTFFRNDEKESILINIEKENLLVRHFDNNEDNRKLRVIYVVKPTERVFNLI